MVAFKDALPQTNRRESGSPVPAERSLHFPELVSVALSIVLFRHTLGSGEVFL